MNCVYLSYFLFQVPVFPKFLPSAALPGPFIRKVFRRWAERRMGAMKVPFDEALQGSMSQEFNRAFLKLQWDCLGFFMLLYKGF